MKSTTKKTTGTTNGTTTNGTPAPETEFYCEPLQLISDTLSNLDTMCARFAYVDGDPELDHANNRLEFNQAASLVQSLLEILRDEVTRLEAGTHPMQTKRAVPQ